MRKLLVVAIWGAVACGPPPPPPPPPVPDPHEVIAELIDEIRTWETELGTAPQLRGGEWCVPRPAGPLCELPVEPVKQCRTKCDLAEMICDDADDICSIAEQLEGDRWAEDRCDEARAACKRGTRRCCACERDARVNR